MLLAELLHSTIVALVANAEPGGKVDSGRRVMDVLLSLVIARTTPGIIPVNHYGGFK